MHKAARHPNETIIPTLRYRSQYRVNIPQQNGRSGQEGSMSSTIDRGPRLNIDIVSVIAMVTQLECVTLDPKTIPTQPHHDERGPR